VCIKNKKIMSKLYQLCLKNNGEGIYIKAGGVCKDCNFRSSAKCDCKLCNVVPHSQHFELKFNPKINGNYPRYPPDNVHPIHHFVDLRERYEKKA
jgi:hypothetical protein